MERANVPPRTGTSPQQHHSLSTQSPPQAHPHLACKTPPLTLYEYLLFSILMNKLSCLRHGLSLLSPVQNDLTQRPRSLSVRGDPHDSLYLSDYDSSSIPTVESSNSRRLLAHRMWQRRFITYRTEAPGAPSVLAASDPWIKPLKSATPAAPHPPTSPDALSLPFTQSREPSLSLPFIPSGVSSSRHLTSFSGFSLVVNNAPRCYTPVGRDVTPVREWGVETPSARRRKRLVEMFNRSASTLSCLSQSVSQPSSMSERSSQCTEKNIKVLDRTQSLPISISLPNSPTRGELTPVIHRPLTSPSLSRPTQAQQITSICGGDPLTSSPQQGSVSPLTLIHQWDNWVRGALNCPAPDSITPLTSLNPSQFASTANTPLSSGELSGARMVSTLVSTAARAGRGDAVRLLHEAIPVPHFVGTGTSHVSACPPPASSSFPSPCLISAPFDAVVVLSGGGCKNNGELSPLTAKRLDVAVEMGPHCRYFVCSGCLTFPSLVAKESYFVDECQAMTRYLMDKGVDPSRVLMERWSCDTLSNAHGCRHLVCHPMGLTNILIVTSAFHMARSRVAFDWIFASCEGNEDRQSSSPFTLTYISADDVGLSDVALREKKKKEEASTRAILDERIPLLKTTAEITKFILTSHNAYRASANFITATSHNACRASANPITATSHIRVSKPTVTRCIGETDSEGEDGASEASGETAFTDTQQLKVGMAKSLLEEAFEEMIY
eukprot:GHVN01082751.1.p1 GENE.GHVN01082751.1~~GHVN01082751.1.p1  ORF type:complete len:723 (+),score=162.68 GHVN01082751.1:390-2558(+)